MKSHKALLLGLSLLYLHESKKTCAMEMGVDALGYIAQDIYAPISPLVLPTIAVASIGALAYAAYETYQLGKGLEAAAEKVGIETHDTTIFDTFLLPFKTVANAVHLSQLPAQERKKEIRQTVKQAIINKVSSKIKAFKEKFRRR